MQSLAHDLQLRPTVGRGYSGRERSRVAPGPADWRQQLPVLTGDGVTLREMTAADAASLFAFVGTPEVSQFLSPPPPTVERVERFIEWTHAERGAGRGICFGIVPDGCDVAVGMIQIRALEPGFLRAEWGFALGSDFWGSGLFVAAARLVLAFAFDTVGVHRLEARSVIQNGRGNGVLRKLGAVQEGVLRRSFLRHGQYHDQALWSILEEDWRQACVAWRPTIH